MAGLRAVRSGHQERGMFAKRKKWIALHQVKVHAERAGFGMKNT
jgi:hypothetical protein